MEIILLFLLSTLCNIVGCFFVIRYFSSTISKEVADQKSHVSALSTLYKNISVEIRKLHSRIDQIFVVDRPSANEATKTVDMGDDFNEQNAIDLPPHLKFELEGGDSQVPPGYSVEESK